MSEESTNPQTNQVPEWYSKPPEWMSKPPEWMTKQPASNVDPSSPPVQNRGYGSDILQELQALPERLANTLLERAPKSETVKTDEKATTTETKTAETNTPGRKTLQEWWFGS